MSEGKVDLARILIRIIYKLALRGIDVNRRDAQGVTALIKASEKLDQAIMTHILRIGEFIDICYILLWRHNGRDGVSNIQLCHCLLDRSFRRRSKKTSKFHVIGLWVGNSPGTGEFPAQMTSNAENVSISWRHHVNL